MGVKTFSSLSTNANRPDLARCLGELRKELEKTPEANERRDYQCGSYMWQVGGPKEWGREEENLKVFNKCETELTEGAHMGHDWFLCRWRDFWGFRVVSWTPIGTHLCPECHPPSFHPEPKPEA
ncbi:hypothetical protein BST61_g10236 [Cercospora zeina]